ncbi:helix-turn-helix domain-containing protein [Testudinibacter sp. P27/CKL/0425]
MKSINSTNTHNQRLFILARLREAPHSTLEFRDMGVCSPAARVLELKEQGYKITTHFRDEYDSAGVKHRIGVYTLRNE